MKTFINLARLTSCVRNAPVIVLLMVFVPVTGLTDSLGLGVTLNGSGWEGDNGSGNSDFESDDGGQFAHQFGR